MKSRTDRLPGEGIGDEIDFATGGINLPVAIIGEMFGVTFSHRAHSGILDENAPKEGV